MPKRQVFFKDIKSGSNPVQILFAQTSLGLLFTKHEADEPRGPLRLVPDFDIAKRQLYKNWNANQITADTDAIDKWLREHA